MVDDIKVGLLEKFMPPLYLEAAGKKKPPVDLGSAAKLCTGVDPVPPPRLGEAPLLCTGVDLVPAARLGAAPKLRPGGRSWASREDWGGEPLLFRRILHQPLLRRCCIVPPPRRCLRGLPALCRRRRRKPELQSPRPRSNGLPLARRGSS